MNGPSFIVNVCLPFWVAGSCGAQWQATPERAASTKGTQPLLEDSDLDRWLFFLYRQQHFWRWAVCCYGNRQISFHLAALPFGRAASCFYFCFHAILYRIDYTLLLLFSCVPEEWSPCTRNSLQSFKWKIWQFYAGTGSERTFPTLASTPEGRMAFAKSAIAYANDRGFDGIDLDWEWPGNTREIGKAG